MNQDQKELTLEESIKQVMQTLPPIIRDYLAQAKYSIVAANLVTKYDIHIDQGGILEREIMLLLMGIENPNEFTKALVEEAKLDQKTIDGIIQDINTQIFMPLREEEMKPAAPPTKPAAWGASVPPAPRPPQINASVPSYAPPLQSPKYFHLENKIAPLPPKVIPEIKPSTPTSPKATQGTAIIPKVEPLAPESQTSLMRKLLEDHEEPHVEISNKVQGVSAKTAPPPPNLPGAMPPITPEVKKPVPPIVPVPPAPVRPPYSTDPYRETIDTQ